MSRINVKLVAVLSGTLLVVALVVGVLLYLSIKQDTERIIAKGDQFMAEGEYRKAFDSYGRAVSKKPGRIVYLQKLEEALLLIVPSSRDEANDLYKQRIGILQQRVKYHGSDPESHHALMDEVIYAARMTNTEDWWARVGNAATDMRDRLLDGDPARLEASLYASMATFRRAVAETDEDLDQAEADLRVYLEANPTSDLGWATMLAGQLTRMQKEWTAGRQGRSEELALLADETFAAAVSAVPEGPEVARMAVLHLALKHERQAEIAGKSLAASNELNRSVTRLVELIGPTDDPVLIADTADLLMTISWPDYADEAADLLRVYVASAPDRLIHLAMLGELLSKLDKLDEAESSLQKLINASGLSVSYEAKVHDQLQKQAAALLVDVAQRRWEVADPGEAKSAAILGVGQAVDNLRALVIDPENDNHYLRAEGKYFFCKGDYRAAATRFDLLCRSDHSASDDVLEYASRSLERINEIGLAFDRMRTLLHRHPQDERLLYDCSRLAMNLKRYDEADQFAQDLLKLNPTHNRARQIRSMVKMVKASGDTGEELDPVAQSMRDAVGFLQAGDINSARETLKNVLEVHPDNPQLLYTLIRVEMTAGEKSNAKLYIDRLLQIQPDNQAIIQTGIMNDADDPVEAVRTYVDTLSLGEGDHAVSMVVNLATFAGGQRRSASQSERMSDSEGAATATAMADRADAQIATYLAKANELVPESPQLQEYQFRRAMIDKDWETADRMVERVRKSNADLAGGSLFAGELALARDNPEEAISLLSDASTAIPHSSMVWRVLGNAYERIGNFGEAHDAYDQAYTNNPNDIETVRYFVTLLTRVGDDTKALLIMRTAHRVIPNDIGLREVWLRLETRAGDPQIVLQERRRIYDAAPGDRVNAEQLASFLATAQPTRETILDEMFEPAFTEISWIQLSTGTQQEAIRTEKVRWHAECDQILSEIEESGTVGALEAAVLRAMLLRERGNVAAGQQVIEDLVAQTPEGERSIELMLALGSYQRDAGQIEKAIETFKQARSLQDAVEREAEVALGRLYFQIERFDEAISAYQRATEVNPDSDVLLNVIECYAKLGRQEQVSGVEDRQFGRSDEAEVHFTASLAHFQDAESLLTSRREGGDDGYFEAMLSASIADGTGDLFYGQRDRDAADRAYGDRDGSLRRAEELNPTNPQPLIQRAQHLLRAFIREVNRADLEEAAKVRRQSTMLDDALRALDRADEVQAGNLQTSFTRVAVHQARQDLTGAIGELTRLITRFPDNLAARRRLVQHDGAERVDVVPQDYRGTG